MKKISLRYKIGASCAALISAVTVMTAAVPAHAAEHKVTDNCGVPWINCAQGDIFLFYNSKAYSYNSDGTKFVTSWSTFYGNVYNYEGTSQYQGSSLTTYRYVFNGNGSGAWQYMKNNAASVMNCARDDNYRVYYNSGYGCTSQHFA